MRLIQQQAATKRAARADGVYLYDEDGNRYLDGCGGALVASIGHGVAPVGQAMVQQIQQVDYVYRYHFSTQSGEDLAEEYCGLMKNRMGGVYFANSGSEASECAVKLARCHHLAKNKGSRHKVISRWQSYHGITMGALSWSGFTGRRVDYDPYLAGGVHIPPAYCYRCWFNKTGKTCRLECAEALESAILTQHPDTVAAFIFEPVSGSSLAAAAPPAGYLERIRKICDQYGVLMIAEEVMTGAYRTGENFFAMDYFGVQPDLVVFGKGVGGGYYPLAGVMVTDAVYDVLKKDMGGFAAGQSHAAHPVGMAAGAAVLDYMRANDLPNRSQKAGEALGKGLKRLADIPMVGDVRGVGMIRGVEFVKDQQTGEPFDPELAVYAKVYAAAKKRGLIVLPGSGCNRGITGDTALLGPPLTISDNEIAELCRILQEAVEEVAVTLGL